MNSLSDVSISPALLQAISQTLTSKETGNQSSKQNHSSNMHPRIKIKQEILEARNSSLSEESKTDIGEDEASARIVNILQGMQKASETDEETGHSSQYISPGDIKNMLKWKIQHNVPKPDGQSEDNLVGNLGSSDQEAMVNVLTTLAMQQAKTLSMASKGSSSAEIRLPENVTISQTQEEVVADQRTVMIESAGQTYYVRTNTENLISETVSSNAGETHLQFSTAMSSEGDISGQGSMHQDVDVSCIPETAMSQSEDNSMSNDGYQPCPVCGDAVSGYHYGIFTCESCKGFFKRTVQNNKSFTCHRNGDCEISRGNRKKCPCCRFAKCVQMGMKTQAVRLDRTRGGRSSYDGCSPRNRPKIPVPVKKPKVKRPQSSRSVSLEDINVTLPTGEDVSGSQLMAILNKSGKALLQGMVKPMIPQILSDIVGMESLLCDDETDTDFPMEKISDTDPNVIMSMLQLAELKLYKLVRWARNLPQFSSIATDDQILLLQNSWCEILTLNCCFKSMSTPSEIQLPFGKSIDLEKAISIGHGVDDIISRMLFIAEHLNRLQVDQHEFVALKVLILISPDIKGMKDPSKVVEHQDAITEALRQYTESHYPQMPNKYGQLLMRLTELAKISMLTKEALNSIVPPSLQSCGLLFELLKGDTGKEES
ncbi:nuclear hormone receptor FTZ-F1 beta-like [Saccostrea echinata]|uniref:nuclear hormone receptor FTZ-F1 beta-like n=1 Tax=Saccostrea echinata TaxID=191078 RepID=UPI002A805B3D|nr:nuclear hormone receptor FTZ-F1 beta-like [Saccostrea echinata]XP_061189414.1 nuclear hormone receptor FTZ-F1 beta-like [Saccostrea echinata]